MFGFGKQKVTHLGLAEGFYKFAVEFTELIVNRELDTAGSPYAGIDKQHFMHEWLIIMFWIIHRAPCKCDKVRLMGLIHKTYFEACGLMQNKQASIAEQKLILSRYNEYDSVFNPVNGPQDSLLGGTIAKNILNQDEMVLDASVCFKTAIDIFLLMDEIKAVYNKYKVVD